MCHKRTLSVAIVLAMSVGAGIGCGRRAHTSRTFGVANHTLFDHQAQATTHGSGQGLDSEEAAVVHERYRETLGTRGAEPRNDPRSSVLILDEGRHEAAPKKK